MTTTTEHDERRGMVKTCWNDVRERVAKVNPTFAQLVDALAPGKKEFPLYLGYFPYGTLLGDTHRTFYPKRDGGVFTLSDPDAPTDMVRDLSYEHFHYKAASQPLEMLLEKHIEFIVNFKNRNISAPWSIYFPGTIYPFSKALSVKNPRAYAPAGIFETSAGVRSAFMLPNIGSAGPHTNLQRNFNVHALPPKNLYDHWQVFGEIAQSAVAECDWRCCIMYFSENWMIHLHEDPAWQSLKMYLFEKAWLSTEYLRNHKLYSIAFSMIQNKKNLKLNPYLIDTAHHLFSTILGETPGYAPATDEEGLPLQVLQKAYLESYGLNKYWPTIMQARRFDFENDIDPIYYSLQYPAIHIFSPKSRKEFSTLREMRELEHIVERFREGLAGDDSICFDTILQTTAKNIQFDYFHSELDLHKVIKPSQDLCQLDPRFSQLARGLVAPESAVFPSEATFVRGCISMKKKSTPR